nr:MAG: hypothetical protein [Bacteriophage sp.]
MRGLPFLSQLEISLQKQLDEDLRSRDSISFDGPDLAEWLSAYLLTQGYPEVKELHVVNGCYNLKLKGNN